MPRASWSWNHCPGPDGILTVEWSLPVSRYKADRLRQSGTRIKKPRKERAALRPCANRTASTWRGQVRLWKLSAERKPAPARRTREPKPRRAPEGHPTPSASPPAGSTTAPTVRTNERPSMAHGCYPLVAETKVRPHPSGHPLTESARQCPAASTHSAGSSEQITVLTRSIDALTPRLLKRSIPTRYKAPADLEHPPSAAGHRQTPPSSPSSFRPQHSKNAVRSPATHQHFLPSRIAIYG